MADKTITITISGTDHEIEFKYKGVQAVAKMLGNPKLKDVEKMLEKIGYDNAHKVAGELLRKQGVKCTDDEVYDSIEDASFPFQITQALGFAIMGQDAAELAEVQKAVSEGN